MSTEVQSDNDSTTENVIVGAAVALAIVVGIGMAALQLGLIGGSKDPLTTGAPLVTAIHALSGGDPQRVLISGSLVDLNEGPAIEAAVHKFFPTSEVKNSARTMQDNPQAKKPATPKSSTVRISFAADAVNEAWPRPRFGDVKRLEMVWKDSKIALRGAVYTEAAKQTLDKAFASLPKDSQGSVQVRVVERPVVPAADLQQTISQALAGRVIAFANDGSVDAKDAVVTAIAPLIKDLRGLEIWISAGADDRAVAAKQAEAVKAALISNGADGNGLRAVPAAKNNPLALIVREKE